MTAVFCILSLIVMIFVLVIKKDSQQSQFISPPFDSHAVSGIPDVPDDLKWGEVDVQIFKASICSVVTLKGGQADIWLTNPESNKVWLKVRALDDNGDILGETGLIKPGEYVQSLVFDIIPKTGTAIGLKLMAYQPETYYSEGSVTLNTMVKVGK